MTVTLAPATAGDAEALVALRIAAMRASLERIGRFDPGRARERFLAGFSPAHTRHIVVAGERVGFVVVKPWDDGLLLDHLYLQPRHQGRGIGSAVLALIFAEADGLGRRLRVGALRGSDANRFYTRHGFVAVEEGEWDVYYVRAATRMILEQPETMSIMNITVSDNSTQIHRHADFPSTFAAARHVDVWLPPGYGEGTDHFRVLYMHDGQNLFDPALVSTGVDWGVDEALTRLAAGEGMAPAIVVGVWNSPQRWRDYMPQKPVAGVTAGDLPARFVREKGGLPQSDRYLRFLVEELKPFIDAAYRTLPGQDDTFIMGSSMGGLISLYALVEYPQIFGGAGCLSTHWPAAAEPLLAYFGAVLPPPGRHKIYFDYGTATLDADYEPFQQQMDQAMAAAGYTQERDWMTRKFPGDAHTEAAWRGRLEIPLRFLLG
jgi:predicted alpha/beta superfamily hydrolase/GNAT superfamily N-acetyltransferase